MFYVLEVGLLVLLGVVLVVEGVGGFGEGN